MTSITAGLAVIKGIGSGGYQFIDVVLYAFFGTPTVIASIALNAPAARTYAPDSGGALKISLVSDAQAPYTITSTQMLS